MEEMTRKKWDRAALTFDLMNGWGPELRWGEAKKQLFSLMEGRILFVAVGTGLDIQHFPLGREITGVDISPGMLAKAKPRAEAYHGELRLSRMDVTDLEFPDGQFDQVFTSCTFCSVPDPVAGLRSLYRVLKPGGLLGMFEHTGSRWFPFNLMLNLMTPLTRRYGPAMNRPTEENVAIAGFKIVSVNNHYLDVVKSIRALKPE